MQNPHIDKPNQILHRAISCISHSTDPSYQRTHAHSHMSIRKGLSPYNQNTQKRKLLTILAAMTIQSTFHLILTRLGLSLADCNNTMMLLLLIHPETESCQYAIMKTTHLINKHRIHILTVVVAMTIQ